MNEIGLVNTLETVCYVEVHRGHTKPNELGLYHSALKKHNVEMCVY